ncbi:MAG TPA: glycoside hydrolase family 47 protein, partial [Thermoanaerobaculia bacterium]|nr:glycoside hydrolase family 47 protein [Thermoanaerobaculia bacterium]
MKSSSPGRFCLRQPIATAVLLLAAGCAPARRPAAPVAGSERARLAEAVRGEFERCWHAYEKDAWGHDELRPVSRTPRDWYGAPLLITPVDALDTMLLMRLDADAAR